jgi:site-specific recombinase XerD
VFPGAVGDPIGERAVRNAMARVCRRAELPLLRVHDLRHTAATLMLLAGVNVKVVSERLGHATIAITLQTYSHVLRARPKRSTCCWMLSHAFCHLVLAVITDSTRSQTSGEFGSLAVIGLLV